MIKLNEPAKADLKEIWIHIAENNFEAANQLLEDFRDKFRLLEKNPKIGRERSEILIKLRSFPFKTYIIFYFEIEDGVEIFRVMHGARNIEGLFDDFFEGLSN